MMENLLSLNLVLCFLKKNKIGHMCESVFYRYETKVTFFHDTRKFMHSSMWIYGNGKAYECGVKRWNTSP